MSSIYQLKPKFQALLRPLCQRLAKAGVTANQVTLSALGLSIVTGALIALFSNQQWPLILVPLIMLVRMALNAIDGMLAREHNMQSSLGAILNELGDVLSDIALYLPFALIPGINPWIVFALVILAVISEMTGVVAVQIGASRRYDGPMGKSDRAFVFGLIALLLFFELDFMTLINIALGMVSLMLVFTSLNRGQQALNELENQ